VAGADDRHDVLHQPPRARNVDAGIQHHHQRDSLVRSSLTTCSPPCKVTTTYCGYQITIEPYEWGFLAQIVEPSSGRRFMAASPAAMRALDDAFDVIDGGLPSATNVQDGCPDTEKVIGVSSPTSGR
jgi:hypothetical protein